MSKAAFPNLIIGTVERIADDDETQTVFDWAKHHGYWKAAPAQTQGFRDFVQLVSLKVKDASSADGVRKVTVLMTREELRASALAVGDLARYSPHDAAHETKTFDAPAENAYWHLVGCVAVLCRASDRACPTGYQSGLFRRSNGQQLDYEGRLVADGVRIDPQTLRPRQAPKASITQ